MPVGQASNTLPRAVLQVLKWFLGRCSGGERVRFLCGRFDPQGVLFPVSTVRSRLRAQCRRRLLFSVVLFARCALLVARCSVSRALLAATLLLLRLLLAVLVAERVALLVLPGSEHPRLLAVLTELVHRTLLAVTGSRHVALAVALDASVVELRRTPDVRSAKPAPWW